MVVVTAVVVTAASVVVDVVVIVVAEDTFEGFFFLSSFEHPFAIRIINRSTRYAMMKSAASRLFLRVLRDTLFRGR